MIRPVIDEWPLVGRRGQVVRIGEVLADPDCHGLVLVGAPGIGKTRLGREAVALARRAGFATVRAMASESASALPLGAFAPHLPAGFADGDPADLLQRAQSALLAAPAGKPLLALVDDAHLLDPVSASLVRQLAGSGAAFVVATLRLGLPVPDAVTALWKDGLVERLDLPPLADADVAELLHAALGRDVDPALTAELTTRAHGNVLFLRELVAHALASGTVVAEEGVYRLRGSIAPGARLVEVIEGRLRQLSAQQRRLLELIALGEPLTIEVLGHLGDLRVVDELERLELVNTGAEPVGPVARLAHPLYGDVLRTGLTGARQASLTGELVEAYSALGLDAKAPVKVALWSLSAGRAVDSELLLQAARRARSLGDAELTQRLAAQAVEQGAGFDAASLLGEAYAMAGQCLDAERTWSQLAKTELDDGQRVVLSTHRFLNLSVALADPDAAMAMLDEQTELVRDEQSRMAMRAPAIGVLGTTGRWGAVRENYPRLAPHLQGLAKFTADITYTMALVMAGRTDEALRVVDEYETGGNEPADLPAIMSLGFPHARVEAYLYRGSLAQAQAGAEAVYARAVASAELRVQVWLAALQAKIALAQGKPETALRWARVAASSAKELGHGPSVGDELTLVVRALSLLGRPDEAEAALRRYESVPLPGITYRRTLLIAQADLAAARGSYDRAKERLREAAELAHQEGDRVLELLALHDIARLGWPGEVADRLSELAAGVDGELADVRAAHASAAAAGDGAALESAGQRFAELGAVLLAAEAAAEGAVVWQRAGDERRSRAAGRLAEELAARCEGASTRALAAPRVRAVLTPAQQRIAALAASGRSNREIALELVLSVRTVENTLARVYSTLGIRSRSDLAAALGGSAPAGE